MPIQRIQRCITVPSTEYKVQTNKTPQGKKASRSINCVLQFDVKLSFTILILTNSNLVEFSAAILEKRLLMAYVDLMIFREIWSEHSLIDKEQKRVGEFFYFKYYCRGGL